MEKRYYILHGVDKDLKTHKELKSDKEIYQSLENAKKRLKQLAEFYKKRNENVQGDEYDIEIRFKEREINFMRNYFISCKKFADYTILGKK